MAAEGREPRRADAAHLVELGHRPEAAVLRSVVDDALPQRRADPVERLELLERRAVERDGRRRRRGADAGTGRWGRAAPRHDDLLAVGQARRQVERIQVGPPAGTGPADGVEHARTRRKPVHPGPPHLAADVDDQNLRPRVGRIDGQ
jgi:hypothetical protein